VKNQNKIRQIEWSVIEDIELLYQIEDEWRKLAQQAKDTLFVSPEWLMPWINTYWQSNWSLKVITGYYNNQLVVIVPLYLQKPHLFFGCTNLFPLGQGEQEDAEVSSEYQDVLTAIPIEEIAQDIAAQITKINYDYLQWRALLNTADWLAVVLYLDNCTTERSGQRYSIKFTHNERPALSRNNRQKWNKCLNQLNSVDANFYWVVEEEHHEYWQLLKQFHQTRWQLKSQLGAFHSIHFNQFHHLYQSKSRIVISALNINNHIVAINYYLLDQDTLYFYQCGWHSEYANYSPGFALHQWSINQNKTNRYDFMMADLKSTYKSKYGCNEVNDMYNTTQVKSQTKYLLSKVLGKFALK